MAEPVKLHCKCCQKETEQEVIPSISAGQTYYACRSCGTVTHRPILPETAP